MNTQRQSSESELVLKVCDRLGREKEVSLESSIVEWKLVGGEITLRLPITARVEIADHGIWRLLHDGHKWSRLGAHPITEKIEWKTEYPSKFRIRFQGQTWTLAPRNEKVLYAAGPSASLTRKEWTLLGSSLGLHVAIFGTLLGIASLPSVKQALDANVKTKVEILKEQTKALGTAPRPDIKPFQGMTYTKFLSLLAAKEFAQDPAAVLLKKVKKGGDTSGAPNVSTGLGSSLGGVAGAVDAGGGSLSGNLARQKFMVTEGPSSGEGAGAKKISEKQLALLKAKFRDLQADFQRLYSRILVTDSSLSATVSLELVVKPSGYLSVGSFRARGTYRPDSLEKLKKGMAEIIDGAFVGTEFAGITLRGENVFVR